jgi:hypothetical protein
VRLPDATLVAASSTVSGTNSASASSSASVTGK